MNKRGLNEVITTVLIILLSISAIVIVWGFVKSSLDNADEKISTGSVVLSPLKLESVKINTDDLDVLIERTNSNPELELSGAILIFTDKNGKSVTKDIPTSSVATKLFERKSFPVPKTDFYSPNQPLFDFQNFEVTLRAKTKGKSGENVILSSSSKKAYSDGVPTAPSGGGDGGQCISTAEVYDQIDNNCNALIDECEKQLGVCAGSIETSGTPEQLISCDIVDYITNNPNYRVTERVTETRFCSDGLDNDCDGTSDSQDSECLCANVANPCINQYSTQCSTQSTIQTCQPDVNGCLVWNTASCPNGNICDSTTNTCVPQQTPLPTGLVAYWNFDNDNANDATNGNDGIPNGGMSISNGVASFDGGNDYITISGISATDVIPSELNIVSGGLTICSKAKTFTILALPSSTGNRAQIFSVGKIISTGLGGKYGLYRDGSKFGFAVYGTTSGGVLAYRSRTTSSNSVSTGIQYFVCGVWDSTLTSPNDIKIYLNKISSTNPPGGNTPGETSITNLNSGIKGVSIGKSIADTSASSVPFYGEIDEVMVFNRALSTSEIAGIFDRN